MSKSIVSLCRHICCLCAGRVGLCVHGVFVPTLNVPCLNEAYGSGQRWKDSNKYHEGASLRSFFKRRNY